MSLKERQKQLESMGISLETSGIKVGEDKCFLVNLNADPALNELLVYYLKVRQIYKKKLPANCVFILFVHCFLCYLYSILLNIVIIIYYLYIIIFYLFLL